MEVGGKLAWELKGGRGKVGKESSSGYWHGKKSFVLLNLLSTATYFYKDPPHSLSRYVAICTSQPTGKSGPQSALMGRLLLWLINSEVSPIGFKPQAVGWQTGEICVHFPLLQSASSPRAVWVMKFQSFLSLKWPTMKKLLWGCVTSCWVKTSAPAWSICCLPHRGFFLYHNRLAVLKNVK